MFPYWFLFSFFAAGAVRTSTRGPLGRRTTPALILGAVIVAVMVGLRYHVGADWFAYERMFEVAGSDDLLASLTASDPGYMFINWLVSTLGLELWGVNFICGTVLAWGLTRFAKEQPNPWLAFVVAVPYLVIVVAMGYSRQGVAIGIILAGLAVVDRAPLWRLGLYLIAAVLFHKSAIILLPVVALSMRQNRLLRGIVIFFTAVGLYYLVVAPALGNLVNNYLDQEYESQGALVRVLMNIPPAILFFLFRRRIADTEQQMKMWTNFSACALIALAAVLIMKSSTAIDRMALYLIPLQLYVLSRLPDSFGRKQTSGVLLAGVLAYSALVQFVWLNFATHSDAWVPYRVFPVTGGNPEGV